MRLFEIPDAIEQIVNEGTDPETGEITEEAIAALDALEGEQEQKALYLGRMIIGERAEGEAVKAQADRLAKRAKSHTNRAARLERYISNNIGDASYRDSTVKIGWRNSEAVVIDDEGQIPETHSTYQPRKPDKKLIKATISGGGKVPGARIEKRRNIQIK